MVPFVPIGARTILDVGCSRGLFGAVLKERDPTVHLTGVEPDPEAAEQARTHYDLVVDGHFPDALSEEASFDCIVFNDVLEHVVEPWSVLARSVRHLAPGGTIVASIPNVRFIVVVRNLALRGLWNYTDWGVLDRTHLRFFTRASIEGLFAGAGFRIESLTPINPIRVRGAGLLVGRFRDMRYPQFAVVARRDGMGN
jgi:2-polyprenyl-3-methyl-5-hydroxy-6-metoxy-1,4-benzoquinol methylase